MLPIDTRDLLSPTQDTELPSRRPSRVRDDMVDADRRTSTEAPNPPSGRVVSDDSTQGDIGSQDGDLVRDVGRSTEAGRLPTDVDDGNGRLL